MSLVGYLQQRQRALEMAYTKLLTRVADPRGAKVSDLSGLLVLREQIIRIDEVIGRDAAVKEVQAAKQ